MSMVCGEDKAATLGADDYKEPQIICLNDQGGDVMGVSYTLNVIDRPAVYDPSVHHGYKELGDISETVRSRYGTGGNNVPMVVERTALSIGNGQTNNISMSDKANALDTMHDQQAVLSNVVRRLTPLEAERLQGYPDRWSDVPGASDSKRYRALGNSIALPFWEHLAHRFVEIGNVQTIGSLFAGIGGFELVFQRAGAETKWDSEIDPFCRKVLEYHFGNEETNKEGDVWKYLNR